MPEAADTGWLIPPGSESSKTGVPKPDWYDKPHEEWPFAARQWGQLYAKALRYSAMVDGAGDALYAVLKEGADPTDRDQLFRKVNERLQGFRASLASGWKYLEPAERKTFALLSSEILNVDFLLYRGGTIELRYPLQPSKREVRKTRLG